eukprot:651031-Prymnesium_polylepis.1
MGSIRGPHDPLDGHEGGHAMGHHRRPRVRAHRGCGAQPLSSAETPGRPRQGRSVRGTDMQGAQTVAYLRSVDGRGGNSVASGARRRKGSSADQNRLFAIGSNDCRRSRRLASSMRPQPRTLPPARLSQPRQGRTWMT